MIMTEKNDWMTIYWLFIIFSTVSLHSTFPQPIKNDWMTVYIYIFFFPQYAFEVLFRSQQYALMDNGCREYIFLSEFFMVHDADAMKLFMAVMGKTLQHVQVGGYVCFMSISLPQPRRDKYSSSLDFPSLTFTNFSFLRQNFSLAYFLTDGDMLKQVRESNNKSAHWSGWIHLMNGRC